MVYREGFVITVRQEGQTLKEEAGKVVLPFHSDYELRLRNKTAQDVLAFVYIDGKPAVKGGVLVKGDTHLDLERFVEDNLKKGKKFRFVPLEDKRVEDKGEHENGNIEVRFHKVKYPTWSIPTHIEEYHHYDWWNRPYTYPKYPWGGGEIACSGWKASDASLGATSIPSSGCLNSSDQSLSSKITAFNSAGATVGGGDSSQAFQSVSLDYEKDSYVTVSVRLVGSRETISVRRFCPNCGVSKAKNARFCPECGTRL